LYGEGMVSCANVMPSRFGCYYYRQNVIR
jgi:hypothetical protein